MPDLSSSLAELSKDFSGRLLTSADPAWDVARRVHNGLIDKRPAVIAQCLGSADVAQAVRFAREHRLEIAVRGGAHNVGGRATVDDGMMIDLSVLKYAYVDPKSRTARVGGGTLWGQFNREAQAHGLATTGGVVSSTGVAGLTLGGGLGWLMARHGMALDNLASAEMVLADGRIVRAAADENPDLFWAIRGGGGNFGVAASLEFRLHPVGPMVSGGLVAWPFERARDVMKLFRDLSAGASDDLMLVCALITGPDAATRLAAIVAGFFGDPAQAEEALKPIKSFGQPAMDAMGPIPYAQLNAMLDASYPAGARNHWKAEFIDRLGDDAIGAIIDAFARCPSPMGQVVIENFHGAAARVAPTDTAYALRASGFNVLALSQWMDAAQDAACTAWCRDANAALKRFAGARRYLNYLDRDDSGVAALEAAYGPNLKRLQSLKAKYDPQNVFHLNVNIPPAA
jgi:FAD/FMN-containing dehydrogenase